MPPGSTQQPTTSISRFPYGSPRASVAIVPPFTPKSQSNTSAAVATCALRTTRSKSAMASPPCPSRIVLLKHGRRLVLERGAQHRHQMHAVREHVAAREDQLVGIGSRERAHARDAERENDPAHVRPVDRAGAH